MVKVGFKKLKIGERYERPFLAKLWGYSGFQAISRGVITPSGCNYIILFVTKNKQEALTQYKDVLDNGVLHWEGEKMHYADNRIINAESANDKIHLFYQDMHHSPFIYYGEISLIGCKLRTKAPSQFIFKIGQGQPE